MNLCSMTLEAQSVPGICPCFPLLWNTLHALAHGSSLLCSIIPSVPAHFSLYLGVLGLLCCVRAFSSCSEWGLLFVAVRGLLIAVASLVAELRF